MLEFLPAWREGGLDSVRLATSIGWSRLSALRQVARERAYRKAALRPLLEKAEARTQRRNGAGAGGCHRLDNPCVNDQAVVISRPAVVPPS